jgi:rhamnosyltransferase subunit B
VQGFFRDYTNEGEDMKKHFVITTCGTSGDIFPFIELGKYLLRTHHRVSFITHPNFERVVTNNGLDLIPFGTVQQGLSILNDPAMWQLETGFNALWAKTIEPNMRSIRSFIHSTDPGEEVVILSHPALLPLANLAKAGRDRLKVVLFYLYPLIIRTDYRRLALGGNMTLPQKCPRVLRKLLYSLLDAKFFDVGIVPSLNKERLHLGLPPIKHFFSHIQTSADLYVTLFPEWFAPTKPDYPQPLISGDFSFYASPTDSLSDELTAFLDAGAPPILFTAGSGNPGPKKSKFFNIAVDVAKKMNARAIFMTKCRDQLPERLPDSMLWQEFAPFDKLISRSSIVVHHGGIGTAAVAMRAGVPQVVVPFAYDNFDNAMTLKDLGIAQSIPMRLLTKRRLLNTLVTVQRSPSMEERCLRVSDNYRVDPTVDQLMERVVAAI